MAASRAPCERREAVEDVAASSARLSGGRAQAMSHSNSNKPNAYVLLHRGDDTQRIHAKPHEPALHVGATYIRALERAGYQPQPVGSAHSGRMVREGWRYSRLIRPAPLAAVVQGYGTFAARFSRIGLSRQRPRIIMHTWKVPWTGSNHFTARMMDRVLERVIQASSLTVLVSPEQKRLIEKSYPRVPTAWVPVAADTRWWTPGPPQTDLLDRLNVKLGEFLLVGGDVDREEDAPIGVAAKLARPLVRVTKDPRTADKANAAFARLGAHDAHCVCQIPWTELRDLYRSAWAVLIAPTASYHPAGLTTLSEALACGAPVLFPRNTTAEGYVRDGENAVLFDSMKVPDILAACKALDDAEARQRIAAAARRTCDELLNLDRAAEILAERLRELKLDAASVGNAR